MWGDVPPPPPVSYANEYYCDQTLTFRPNRLLSAMLQAKVARRGRHYVCLWAKVRRRHPRRQWSTGLDGGEKGVWLGTGAQCSRRY